MKFIKENSYDIVKFFIYQIGLAVFSLTLAIPLSAAIEEDKADVGLIVQLCVSILAILFYSMLVYTVSWEHGATERIRIDAGKSAHDKFKGAKIALIASIPNFLVSSVAILSAILYAEGNVWNAVFVLVVFILGLMESMYLGTVQFVASFFAADLFLSNIIRGICFFVLPCIIVFASHLGYTLGDKNIKIFGFMPDKKHKR